MPSIIQFFHPGGEHGHDKGNKSHKSWNEGKHKRKFMSATGDYLGKDNIFVSNQEMMFWGEWEPNSYVKEFIERDNDKFPKYVHFPYIPKKLPVPDPKACNQKHWQNTDPFVFGDNFKYAICRQGQKYSGYRICDLSAETIIIFGSLYADKKDGICRSMKVDTVFVVSNMFIDKKKLLDIKDENLSENDKKYFDLSFCYAFKKKEDFPEINKIYTSVKYENRTDYNDMFSFTPAMKRIQEKPIKGFRRIEIPLFDQTKKQTQTPFFVKDYPIEEYVKYWNDLKNLCLDTTGCIATKINMPKLENAL
jgi:hypothetical protein